MSAPELFDAHVFVCLAYITALAGLFAVLAYIAERIER